MTTGAPPRAAVDKHREALELARRRTALQVDTVAHAVTGLDDTVGWSRLTELGTASTVRAQTGAVTATTELLSATLDAAGVVADMADALPGIEPGRLASGRDVRGMFDRTRDIVQARMAGGAAFPEALDASANVLTAIASSEPHRIARDGQFNVGLSDSRFDRFRRVTVGTSCAFCAMLATRGAVYLTAESAGQSRRYHYKCDCYVELVVDPAAIESSKSTSGDWRNAIRDQERLRAADVRREFADLTDDDLARLAGNRPDSALSADLLAERARRAGAPAKVVVDSPRLRETVSRARENVARVESDLAKTRAARAAREAELRDVYKLTPAQMRAQRKMEPAFDTWRSQEKFYKETLASAQARLDDAESALGKFTDDAARFEALPQSAPESAQAAAAKANPGFTGFTTPGPGEDFSPFEVNCANVAPTYEMRRRGFDVVAAPMHQDQISAMVAERWKSPDGSPRFFRRVAPDAMVAEVEEWPIGARGFVSGQWKQGGGHIWNVERTADGVRFVEAQDGTGLALVDDYLANVVDGTLEVMRVDDLAPTNLLMGVFQ